MPFEFWMQAVVVIVVIEVVVMVVGEVVVMVGW